MMPVRKNQNWLPSIFNDFFGNEWVDKSNVTAPAVNIVETQTDFRVEVAAPGMTKEDFRVDINEDNELLVTMEKKSEQTDPHRQPQGSGEEKHKADCNCRGTYLRREFSYSRFQQRLILPDNVMKEKITASVENGVLTIEIPKKQAQPTAAARQIEIR